jgi:hypothetical protein
MEAWFVPIIVAIIGGPIMVVMQKLRNENTSQHAEGRELLNRVLHKVDEVGTKIDGHIGWHKGKEEK